MGRIAIKILLVVCALGAGVVGWALWQAHSHVLGVVLVIVALAVCGLALSGWKRREPGTRRFQSLFMDEMVGYKRDRSRWP